MNILLVNDDGVWAPGIRALYGLLRNHHHVMVVAPVSQRSTTGHTLTLDRPLRADHMLSDVWSLDGHPADCTLFGLRRLMKECPPDVVISGINDGGNMGQDIFYSGTLAGAREAVFQGVPAIAISLCTEHAPHERKYFRSAARVLERLLRTSIHKWIPTHCVLNINVPNLPLRKLSGVHYSHLGFRCYVEDFDERKDNRGRPYYWISGRQEGYESYERPSDLETVESGSVSVCPIFHGPMDREALRNLKTMLKSFSMSTI